MALFSILLLATLSAILALFIGIPMLIISEGKLPGETPTSFNLIQLVKIYRRIILLAIPIIFLEELFARWFFLGVLIKIPVFSPDIRFFILFLVGNSIWAGLHLKNHCFKEKCIIKILPQFTSGVIFTYAFVQFGIWGSFVVHLISNLILMLIGYSIMKHSIFSKLRQLITCKTNSPILDTNKGDIK